MLNAESHNTNTALMSDNNLSPMTELKTKAYLVESSPICGARTKIMTFSADTATVKISAVVSSRAERMLTEYITMLLMPVSCCAANNGRAGFSVHDSLEKMKRT